MMNDWIAVTGTDFTLGDLYDSARHHEAITGQKPTSIRLSPAQRDRFYGLVAKQNYGPGPFLRPQVVYGMKIEAEVRAELVPADE